LGYFGECGQYTLVLFSASSRKKFDVVILYVLELGCGMINRKNGIYGRASLVIIEEE
jgi:hypothetical protein